VLVEWAKAIAAQLEWDSAMEVEPVWAAEQGLVLAREWAKAAGRFAAEKAPAARKPRYIARKPRWPAPPLNLRPSIEPEEGKA
jgi:hypothetical protein